MWCRALGPAVQENSGGLHRISQNQAKGFSLSYRGQRPQSTSGLVARTADVA